jgi:hypothetical protein
MGRPTGAAHRVDEICFRGEVIEANRGSLGHTLSVHVCMLAVARTAHQMSLHFDGGYRKRSELHRY